MWEFIKSYWLESITALVFSGFLCAFKWLFGKLKKEIKEQETIKECLFVLLSSKLVTTCKEYLNRGNIDVDELTNLKNLYEGYHKLGGNSTGTALFKRCCKLPIKK